MLYKLLAFLGVYTLCLFCSPMLLVAEGNRANTENSKVDNKVKSFYRDLGKENSGYVSDYDKYTQYNTTYSGNKNRLQKKPSKSEKTLKQDNNENMSNFVSRSTGERYYEEELSYYGPDMQSEALGDFPETVSHSVSKVEDEKGFCPENIFIAGMTAFNKEEVESYYKSKLGCYSTLQELKHFLLDIVTMYHKSGYLAASLIVEKIDDLGDLYIKVDEGKINNIDINWLGDEDLYNYVDLDLFIERMKEINPFNSKEIRKILVDINDIGGIRAVSIIKKGAEGGVDITLAVEKKLYEVGLLIDNRGNRYVAPYRTLSEYSFYSLIFPNSTDTLLFSWFPAAHGGSPSIGIFYDHVQKTASGLSLGIKGSYSDIQNSILPNIDQFYRSTSGLVDFYAKYPLFTGESSRLTANLGYSMIDNSMKFNDHPQVFEEDVRFIVFGFDYNSLQNQGKNFSYLLNLTFNQGVENMGASLTETALTTLNAVPDFFIVQTSINLNYMVPGSKLFLQIFGKAQYSPNTLVRAKKFFLGGTRNYARGYQFLSLSGDYGMTVSLQATKYNPVNYGFFDAISPYIFTDYGILGNNSFKTIFGVFTPGLQYITSLGVGLKFDLDYNFSVTTELATPVVFNIHNDEYKMGPRFILEVYTRY